MLQIPRLLPIGCVATLLLLAAAVRTPLAQSTAPPPAAPAARWFKGNTHTHTVNSDGDSTPDDVVRWYREHGYNFLVLTDHNYLTSVDGLNAVHGAADKFLVVRGEEVTSTVQSKAVHVNGLNLDTLVPPPAGSSIAAVTQQSVDGIRKANGHPQVNNEGGGGAPGLEEIWDRLLSSGRLMYGVAVDDAHHFKRPGDPLASGPGRGWVYVRADRLDGRALVDALERGDFYASTGVELARFESTPTGISLAVKATAYSRYRVQFIGRSGR